MALVVTGPCTLPLGRAEHAESCDHRRWIHQILVETADDNTVTTSAYRDLVWDGGSVSRHDDNPELSEPHSRDA